MHYKFMTYFKYFLSILIAFSFAFLIKMKSDKLSYFIESFLIVCPLCILYFKKYLKLVFKFRKKFGKKIFRNFVIFCSILSIGLIFSFSLHKIYPKTSFELKLVSNGEKNEWSKTAEAKIADVIVDNYSVMPEFKLEKVEFVGNPFYKLEGTKENPKEVVYLGYGSTVTIRTFPSVDNGIFYVFINGVKHKIDAYNMFYEQWLNSEYTFRVQDSLPFWTMIFRCIYLIGFFFIFTLMLLFLGIKVLLFNKYRDKVKVSKWNILYYAIPTMVVGTFFLTIFFPGVWNIDTVWGLNSIFWDSYTGEQVFLWSLFERFLIMIFGPYFATAIVILQILSLSLLSGYGLFKLQKSGVSRKVLWIVAFLIALLPPNIILIVNIRRDFLWSCGFLGIILFMFDILEDGLYEFSHSKLKLFFLILCSFIVCAFKLNGPITLLFLFIAFCFYYKKQLKKVLLFGFTVFALWISTFFILEQIFVYKEGNLIYNQRYEVMVHQVKYAVSNSENISDELKEKLETILPYNVWKYNASKMAPHFFYFSHGDYFVDKKFDFFKFFPVWWSVFIRHPVMFVEDFLDVNKIFWTFDMYFTEQFEPDVNINNYVDDNEYYNYYKNLFYYNVGDWIKLLYNATTSSFPNAKEFFISLQHSFLGNPYFLFMKTAFYVYIFVFFCGLYIIKNGKKYSLIMWPLFVFSLFLSLTLPQGVMRYLYPFIFSAPFMILHSLLRLKNEK